MKPLRVSQKDLASWLGLGARHIRSLTINGVLTQTPKGYDLKASIHSYLTFLRSKTGTVSDERTRLLKAQADLQELKVRQKNGEVVTRESVAKETFVMIRTARDKMQNIPPRISGVLAAEGDQHRIFTYLTEEINQALEDLSNAYSRATPPTQ